MGVVNIHLPTEHGTLRKISPVLSGVITGNANGSRFPCAVTASRMPATEQCGNLRLGL